MSTEISPAKRKRLAQARRREEEGWAARSSEVVVRFMEAPAPVVPNHGEGGGLSVGRVEPT